MGPGIGVKLPRKSKRRGDIPVAEDADAAEAASPRNDEETTLAIGETSSSETLGEKWNWKRYQREDEALWGLDVFGPGQRLLEAISKAGANAKQRMETRFGAAFAGDDLESGSKPQYYRARNPPVNDLHPPVVSTKPAGRDEVRWMLQPPPPARIMEGKERVVRLRAESARTGSSSGGSSRTCTESSPVSGSVTRPANVQFAPAYTTPLPCLANADSWDQKAPRNQRHSIPSKPRQKSAGPTQRKRHKHRFAVHPIESDSDISSLDEAPIAYRTRRKMATRPVLPTIVGSYNGKDIGGPSCEFDVGTSPCSPHTRSVSI